MYLSSPRVNDKTLIFIIKFINLPLVIKDVYFVSLSKKYIIENTLTLNTYKFYIRLL